jgi:hypothetical protein
MDTPRAAQQRNTKEQHPNEDKSMTPTMNSPTAKEKLKNVPSQETLHVILKVLEDLHLWGVPAADIAQSKRNFSRLANPSSSPTPPTELDLLLRNVHDALCPDPENFRPLQPSSRALYATASLPELLEEKLREELASIGGFGGSKEEDGDDNDEDDAAGTSAQTVTMLHDSFSSLDGYGNAPMRRNPATGVITLLDWARGYDAALLNPYTRFSEVKVSLRHSCYSHFGFVAPQISTPSFSFSSSFSSFSSLSSPFSSSSYLSPPLSVLPPDDDDTAYLLGTGPEGLSYEVLVGREIVRQDMPCLKCGRGGTIAPAGGIGASFADFLCCDCGSHYEYVFWDLYYL